MITGKKPKIRKRLARRRQTKGVRGLVPLIFVALGMLAVFRWQVSALFALFLLPTFVMAFTNNDTHAKDRVLCVALMNIAGIVPFAAEVWARPEMFERVVSNVLNIAVMLGAASVGYLLLWFGPFVAAVILQGLAQDKLKSVAEERKKLLETWGADILPVPEKKQENQ